MRLITDVSHLFKMIKIDVPKIFRCESSEDISGILRNFKNCSDIWIIQSERSVVATFEVFRQEVSRVISLSMSQKYSVQI